MPTLPTLQTQLRGSPTALRLVQIRNRIRIASERSGRPPDLVRLIAASRGLMLDPVREAARAGIRDFCEEFVPEGATKRPSLDHEVAGCTWHFTGTLNPRFLGVAVETFDWIHSVERTTQVRALSEVLERRKGGDLSVLIEVNPIGEAKRTGVPADRVAELAEHLRALEGVSLRGLSFKSEFFMPPAVRLTGYRRTAELAARLLEDGELPPGAGEIAMGSSRDFEEAIAAGATMVRLGEAVFGPPSAAPTTGI